MPKCPTCESPNPAMHPATQYEGEVLSLCRDPWHSPTAEEWEETYKKQGLPNEEHLPPTGDLESDADFIARLWISPQDAWSAADGMKLLVLAGRSFRPLKTIDYAITLLEIEGNPEKALQYLREARDQHVSRERMREKIAADPDLPCEAGTFASSATPARLIGNLLDRWEMLPNDLKSDPGIEELGRAIRAVTDSGSSHPYCEHCKGPAMSVGGCMYDKCPVIARASTEAKK